MFSKKFVLYSLIILFSSNAVAFWGDSFPGPQPTIPPVKLLTLASATGAYFPPIGPQPTVPPETRLILASGQAGGFFPPSGPMPFPPQEELPMILASADMDKQLNGFEKGVVDITLGELGDIISTMYAINDDIDAIRAAEDLPPQEVVEYLVSIIQIASDNGYVEENTMKEIASMTASWFE